MKIILGLLAFMAIGGGAVFAQPAKLYSKNPTGEGDPAAITCRPPMQLEGQRLLGPEVCKPNAEWAQYAKDGMTVAADGRHDVPVKRTGSCQAMGGGGGGATNSAVGLSATMKCD
jgi:hypothetical protein